MTARAKQSLQDELRELRLAAQHSTTEDFPLPKYGGRLWVTMRAIGDYAENRAIVMRQADIRDEATRELHVAAESLVAASVDVFALLEDGSKESLGMGLGAGLAEYLGEPVDNDVQGVFVTFPDTSSVMTFYGMFTKWTQEASVSADKSIEGNSDAAS